MDAITLAGLMLGILGLLASLAGTTLAYFTFISPKKRVDFYLSKTNYWEEVSLDLHGMNSIWRYKKHPEFTIEQEGERKSWDFGVTEKWMKYPLPDASKSSYMYHVRVNGVVIYAEEFITLDGGRYLVPLPRVKFHEKKEDNEYFYTDTQIRIATIIGRFYRMASIHEFIKHNEIEVRKV